MFTRPLREPILTSQIRKHCVFSYLHLTLLFPFCSKYFSLYSFSKDAIWLTGSMSHLSGALIQGFHHRTHRNPTYFMGWVWFVANGSQQVQVCSGWSAVSRGSASQERNSLSDALRPRLFEPLNCLQMPLWFTHTDVCSPDVVSPPTTVLWLRTRNGNRLTCLLCRVFICNQLLDSLLL
jgi:hypothetical protein